jgi:uncharacterized protein (TIGR02145 family)
MKLILAFIIVLYVAGCSPTVRDLDGNEYKTVQIGEQTWMAENLRTSKYRDGTPIANITDDDQWRRFESGAWAHYDNQTANETKYGKLYNWYAVSDSRGLCPEGWHVPTVEEWRVLSGYLGEDAGFKMKSTSGWDKNGNGSNESGFTGLPGGIRYGGRYLDRTFLNVGEYVHFWSSSELSSNSGSAWYLYLHDDGRNLNRYGDLKKSGFSVRCLRD